MDESTNETKKETKKETLEKLKNSLAQRQRKLIPVNIIISIVSLIAAISIIFAPLLTIDVGSITEEIADMLVDESSDAEGESDGSANYVNLILSSFGDLKVNISTYGMAKFAFSANPVEQIVEIVAEEIEKVQDDLVAIVMLEVIPSLIKNSDFAEELNIDTSSIDVQSILNKVDNMLKADSDHAEQAIDDLVAEIREQLVTNDGEYIIPEEAVEEIKEVVQGLYEHAQEILAELGEEMNLESFICVTISSFMKGESNPENSSGSAKTVRTVNTAAPIASESNGSSTDGIYTNYRDLISGLLSSQGGENEGETVNPMEALNESLGQFIPFVKYLVYSMFAFAGIWVIQFLFAFIHLFCKNKRFLMWYTKVWGFTPCLLFGVLPLVAGSVLSSLFEGAEIVAVIFGAISSWTWISGACYLLVWIISVFWAFPIKRKIRKTIKEIRKIEQQPQQQKAEAESK